MEDYKEKLRLAKEALDSGSYDKETIEYIFPELKESEDERIKSILVDFFKDYYKNTSMYFENVDVQTIIDWLEKQNKPQVRTGVEWVNTIDDACEHRYAEEYAHGEYCHEQSFKWGFQEGVDWLEKQSEQKPADKVESKFKVGDWCIDNEDGTIFQIVKVLNNTYTYKTNEGYEYSCTHYSLENDAKLWTIKDAKKGDVIFSNDGHGSDSIELIKSVHDKCINFWFCLSSKNNFKDYHYEVYNGNIPYTNFASRKDATPATKEQRDLLFQKMHEAGYEWDAEKKELRKIEQKPVEWSAYDKATLEYIIEDIKELCDNEIEEDIIETYNRELNLLQAINESIKLSSYTNPATWSEEDKAMVEDIIEAIDTQYEVTDYNEMVNWLKSLKERYTWKPSDEQMEALWDSIPENVKEISEREMLLDSLYQDLKKLRKE